MNVRRSEQGNDLTRKSLLASPHPKCSTSAAISYPVNKGRVIPNSAQNLQCRAKYAKMEGVRVARYVFGTQKLPLRTGFAAVLRGIWPTFRRWMRGRVWPLPLPPGGRFVFPLGPRDQGLGRFPPHLDRAPRRTLPCSIGTKARPWMRFGAGARKHVAEET